MTQLIKQKRPVYRLLLCTALFCALQMQGSQTELLTESWATRLKEHDEKVIPLLTANTVKKLDEYNTLLSNMNNIDTAIDDIKTNTQIQTQLDYINTLLTAMKGTEGGYIWGSQDDANKLWEGIKNIKKIEKGTVKLSLAELYDNRTSSVYLSGFATNAIYKGAYEAIKEHDKNYELADKILKPVLDATTQVLAQQELTKLQNYYKNRVKHLTDFINAQKAIDVLEKEIKKQAPDGKKIAASIQNISTTFNLALLAMQKYHDAEDIQSQLLLGKQIYATIASITGDTPIDQIKKQFYKGLDEIIKTGVNVNNIAKEYATIKPALGVDLANASLLNSLSDFLTKYNDYKLTNGPSALTELDKSLAAAVEAIKIIGKANLQSYLYTVKDLATKQPQNSPNQNLYWIEHSILDEKPTKTFSVQFVENSANVALDALTNARDKITEFEDKTKKSTLTPEQLTNSMKTTINFYLLYRQLLTKKESERALGTPEQTHELKRALISAVYKALDTVPTGTKTLVEMTENIFNDKIASALKSFVEKLNKPAPSKQPTTPPVVTPPTKTPTTTPPVVTPPTTTPPITTPPVVTPPTTTPPVKPLPPEVLFANALKDILQKVD